MHFINVYCIDAHPTGSISPYSNEEWRGSNSNDKEGNPVGQPLSYEERVQLARKTAVEAKINVPLLVDEIDNPAWCTYGPAPNIAYLIGTDGTIIAKQGWYDPKLMEQAITSYLE